MLRSITLGVCLCAAVGGVVIMTPQLLRTQTKGHATEPIAKWPLSATEAAHGFPTVSPGEAAAASPKPTSKTSAGSIPGSANLSKANALSPSSAKRLLDFKRKAPLFLRDLRNNKTVFIENRGQFDRRVKFQVRSGGKTLWVTSKGIVFDALRTKATDVKANGRKSARLIPRAPWLTGLGAPPALAGSRIPNPANTSGWSFPKISSARPPAHLSQ